MEVDLRSFLHTLKENKELIELEDEVSPRYEVTSIFKEVLGEQGGPAVLLNNVSGYPGRKLAGNLLASREKMALALGCQVEDLRDAYLKGRFASLEPVQVQGSAPAQEETVAEEIDLLSLLPAPIFHQGDAGPYLTAGVLLAKDPDTGVMNSGIHRLQLKGKTRLGVFLATPPLSNYFKRSEEEGKPLQVAVALGLHPAELLAAAVSLKEGMKSKIHLAGGLAGRGMPLTPASSLDMMVPATAEIILEGQLLPDIREAEGPFGESTGYYFEAESPILEIQAVTFRKDPILTVIPPWGIETDIILAVFSGAELWKELHRVIPEVRDVTFLPGSLTFQGVIQVSESLSREKIRQLIYLALNLDRRLKHVIVVDDDVDIHSSREVLWALGTRFQGSTDLICLPGLEGYVIDPSTQEGETAKLGFDATARPEGPYSKRYRSLSLPRESILKAKNILEQRR